MIIITILKIVVLGLPLNNWHKTMEVSFGFDIVPLQVLEISLQTRLPKLLKKFSRLFNAGLNVLQRFKVVSYSIKSAAILWQIILIFLQLCFQIPVKSLNWEVYNTYNWTVCTYVGMLRTQEPLHAPRTDKSGVSFQTKFIRKYFKKLFRNKRGKANKILISSSHDDVE